MTPTTPNQPPNKDTDPMQKWQSWVDQLIRQAIGDGDVSWLPGAGRPLALGDLEDHLTPSELRLAHRIMKDHDVVPEWMALRFVLEDKLEKIRKRLRHYAIDYKTRLADARARASFILEREADARWQAALQILSAEADDYNRELLNYNLTVPPQVGQRIPLNFTAEVERVVAEVL